jgi:predicted ATP-grasp superfamily ATP-dependent carboligase
MDFDVFVPDGTTRISLAVVRSLGRKGYKVACGDERLLSMTAASKYCLKSFRYPPTSKSIKKYHHWLIDFLKKNNVKVYLPILDDTTKHAVQNQEEISKYTKLYLPDYESYISVSQKNRASEIARKIGSNVPKSIEITNKRDLDKVKKLNFPVIIKAIECAGGRGNKICNEYEEVLDNYDYLEKKFGKCIVSEYFPPGGDAIGVACLIGENKNIINVFCHKRLKQYPPEGGQSVLCESYEHKEAKEAAIKILHYANYKGIALIEFKVNPNDGKLYFIEVNPRFWGSINLPMAVGIDFPHNVYKLALGEKVERKHSYKLGVMCRWYAGEFLYLFKAQNVLLQLKDLFRINRPDLYYMDIDKKDIMPSIVRLLSVVYAFDPEIFKQIILPKPKPKNKKINNS